MYSDDYYDQCPDLERGVGYYLESDKDGFVITGNYHSSNNKVILMGDSFIESNFIGANQKPNYILESLFLESGLDVEVLNAGVSGSTLLNLLNILINKVANIAKSLEEKEGGGLAVVLIIPSNDSNVLRLQESYWNGSQYYTNIVPSSGEFYQHNQVQKNRKDFENLLRIFSEVCRLYDIQLFVSDIMHRNEDENIRLLMVGSRKFVLKIIYAILILQNKFRYIQIIFMMTDICYLVVHRLLLAPYMSNSLSIGRVSTHPI